MRALERDRRDRFASAAEMARALDDFVVGSKLHIDEVAAFVRDIAAISPRLDRRCRQRHVNGELATPDAGGTCGSRTAR